MVENGLLGPLRLSEVRQTLSAVIMEDGCHHDVLHGFMDLGVNGINYHRNVLHSQQMLPAIKSVAGEQVYLPAG